MSDRRARSRRAANHSSTVRTTGTRHSQTRSGRSKRHAGEKRPHVRPQRRKAGRLGEKFHRAPRGYFPAGRFMLAAVTATSTASLRIWNCSFANFVRSSSSVFGPYARTGCCTGGGTSARRTPRALPRCRPGTSPVPGAVRLSPSCRRAVEYPPVASIGLPLSFSRNRPTASNVPA